MSSKRKSRGSEAVDTPTSKRRKAAGGESAQNTQALGYQLLEVLKSARDKRNDLICAEFESLPDEEDVPDYYDVIKLPIGIETIEDKLDRLQYPTLTTLESDFKRMVANAKTYNEKDSDIYSDAEKIRKLVSNFMTKHNPAYSDPDYVPFPTPIPDEGEREEKATGGKIHLKAQAEPVNQGGDATTDASQTEDTSARRGKRALTLNGPRSQSNAVQSGSAADHKAPKVSHTGFEGKTFQQAQEMILAELLNFTNEDGVEISAPFANLPTRDLRDYYEIVTYPVCLKGVLKQVKGQVGHKKGTGISLLRSWDAFAEEISYIWDNARLYNDDGSEIYIAANELELHFNQRLNHAIDLVEEPAQTKVTLRVPTKEAEPSTRLKLHISGRSGGSDRYNVDSDALKRQQDIVAAGTHGDIRSRSRDSENLASAAAKIESTPTLQTNGVKAETNVSQSPPALSGVRATTSASADNAIKSTLENPASAESVQPGESSATPQPREPPPPPPRDPLEARLRPSGKGLADALITSFAVASQSVLKLNRPFRLRIPPSARLSQQSVTASLPESQNALRVHSTFPTSLFQRPHKIVMRLNKEFVPAIQAREQDLDSQSRTFDVSLNRGAVNVLDLEVLVSLTPRGAPKLGNGNEYEYERITLYLNVFG